MLFYTSFNYFRRGCEAFDREAISLYSILSTFLFSACLFQLHPSPFGIPHSYAQKKEERKRLDATFIVYGLSDLGLFLFFFFFAMPIPKLIDWTRNEYTACFCLFPFFRVPFMHVVMSFSVLILLWIMDSRFKIEELLDVVL